MEKLTLYYPVKPLHINQIFGNTDPKYAQLGLKGHNGIDFYTVRNQPVYAAHDGVVDSVATDSYGGHGVTLISEGREYKTIYWHFVVGSEVVRAGQRVKAGDLLGLANSTGFSTGDHLHFGLKQVMNGYTLNKDNGYFGAIDPKPFFNGYYAEDAQKVLSLMRLTISILQKTILLVSKVADK